MAFPPRRWLFAAFLVLAVAAVAFESTRRRPEPVEPVGSPPPSHANETARLEGGFRWSTTRAGKALFDLLAGRLLGLEGGVHLLDDVQALRIYLDDGRVVLLNARRGRLNQAIDQGAGVRISLLDQVEVVDPDGAHLLTDELIYDSQSRELRAPGSAVVTQPGKIEAELGSFVYRPDSRVLEIRQRVRLEPVGGGGWVVESSRANYRLATGEMVFPAPLRVSGGAQTLIAAGATVSLGDPSEETTFRGRGPILAWGGQPHRRWQMAAAGIDGQFAGQPLEPRTFLAQGPISLVSLQTLEGISRRSVLNASQLEWQPVPGAGHSYRAGPGFRLRTSPPTVSEAYQITGQWLEVIEDPRGSPTELRAWEQIRIDAPGGSAAEGRELRWAREDTGRVVLYGQPARAWRGEDLVEAPRLVFERRRRVLIGEDGALTEIASMHGDEGALFEGNEPVRVRSGSVEMPQSPTGVIVFEGSVQAWQAATSLRAQRLVVDQQQKTLRATGGMHLRLESRRKGGSGGEQTRTVRIQGQALNYSAVSREAVIEGQASYEEPGGQTVRADRIMILRGRPGGVERMEARGSVRLVAPGAHGGGDLLQWEGGEQGMVILKGIKQLARLALPPGRVIEAEEIRYDLASGEVSTMGRAVFQGGEGQSQKGEKP